MDSLIKQYVNKMTINNINDFAVKNNINLCENELNLLLELAKNNYQDILTGNDEIVKKKLKNNLAEENYQKIIKLYTEYKEKYQGYL